MYSKASSSWTLGRLCTITDEGTETRKSRCRIRGIQSYMYGIDCWEGHVINKYLSLLTDAYFIDEMWARKALMWCLNALTIDSSDEIEIEKTSADFDLKVAREKSLIGVDAA